MTVTAISGPTRDGPAGADKSLCRVDTHLLGKTRVMPPSVAAKTAKRLYLQGDGPGMPTISGVLFCPCLRSPSQSSSVPRQCCPPWAISPPPTC